MADKQQDDFIEDDEDLDVDVDNWMSDLVTRDQLRSGQLHGMRRQSQRDWRDVEKYHEMRELQKQLDDNYLEDDFDDLDDTRR